MNALAASRHSYPPARFRSAADGFAVVILAVTAAALWLVLVPAELALALL
jgi:hypothetical protein